jgi:hypothetical protein
LCGFHELVERELSLFETALRESPHFGGNLEGGGTRHGWRPPYTRRDKRFAGRRTRRAPSSHPGYRLANKYIVGHGTFGCSVRAKRRRDKARQSELRTATIIELRVCLLSAERP